MKCPSKQWSGSMTGHAAEANDPDVESTPRKIIKKKKRQSNADRWMDPECGYAKMDPNGIYSMAASFAAITIAMALALWLSLTPG